MITIYNKREKKYENKFRSFKFDEHNKVIEVEVIEYDKKRVGGIKSVSWLKLGEFTICRQSGSELTDLFYEKSLGGKK